MISFWQSTRYTAKALAVSLGRSVIFLPLPLLPITIGRTFTRPSDIITDQAQTVYAEQSKVIREMAQKSNCVIVGRCADYVLRELSPFCLFIYADVKAKIERCRKKGQGQDRLNGQELQRKILSVDKSRSKYYQFYTDQVWGDKQSMQSKNFCHLNCIRQKTAPVSRCGLTIALYRLILILLELPSLGSFLNGNCNSRFFNVFHLFCVLPVYYYVKF